MTNDVLIFGRDNTQRIVSVEPNDGDCVVFTEDEQGVSSHTIKKAPYWILSDKHHGQGWQKLLGELHYKHLHTFKRKDEWLSAKRWGRKNLKDFYSVGNEKEGMLLTKGVTYYKGMTSKEVSILSFDLETIGIKLDSNSRVLLISNTFRRGDHVERKLFAYDEYSGPRAMLKAWCEWVREKDPSILCGHNIMSFDLPYLRHVASDAGTELHLGRDGSEVRWNGWESKFRFDGSRDLHYFGASIYGRELVDTMFLAVKADIGRKYQSYGLKSIMKHENLERKDRVFYDASQIRFNYSKPEEWKKIKAYCEGDSDDSLALFDLFVPPFFYMTQSIPKPFQSMMESASGSQLNALMVRSYLQLGHSIPNADECPRFEGAISFGNPGMYSHCLKFDVASLYPSIMIQYKVDNKEKDPKAHFQQIVSHFTRERLANKKLAKDTGEARYKHLEQSQKIAINSLYGFLGAPGLLFNSPADAAFITEKGREILKKSIEWASGEKYEAWRIKNNL